MKSVRLPAAIAATLLAAAPGMARALDLVPDGVSLQAGAGTHHTRMAGVGLVWDWDFQRMRKRAELTAHTELLVNHWTADEAGGGSQSLTQLVLLPSLRMRRKQGASPWFYEVGIGVSWLDTPYVTPRKSFGTQWNFYDMLGVGYTVGGRDGLREVLLRWVHTSNAGIVKPNPGQDFVVLRLVQRF